MRRIVQIQHTIAAGGTANDKKDITQELKGRRPVLGRIWSDAIEPGNVIATLRNEEKEYFFAEGVDLAAYHRANQEKALLDEEGCTIQYSLKNNSASAQTVSLYFEVLYV